VRFNGHGQHLRCVGTGLRLTEGTLFLVVRPAANLGGFRAFFAANAPQQHDYLSGFTVDLGPPATLQFQWLNVEGRGFTGAANLLDRSYPLGTLHVLRVDFSAADRQVRLSVDGRPSGVRPWQSAPLSAEELTVGARYYTNGPGPQQVRGFLAGDVAEVLLFNRVLSGPQAQRVQRYLQAKYASLANELAREAVDCERWNMLNPDKKQKVPYITQQLSKSEGPVIASSDYIRSVSNQVRQYVPGTYTVLGTDGFGRSDTRKNLRRHFEVNSHYVVLATNTPWPCL